MVVSLTFPPLLFVSSSILSLSSMSSCSYCVVSRGNRNIMALFSKSNWCINKAIGFWFCCCSTLTICSIWSQLIPLVIAELMTNNALSTSSAWYCIVIACCSNKFCCSYNDSIRICWSNRTFSNFVRAAFSAFIALMVFRCSAMWSKYISTAKAKFWNCIYCNVWCCCNNTGWNSINILSVKSKVSMVVVSCIRVVSLGGGVGVVMEDVFIGRYKIYPVLNVPSCKHCNILVPSTCNAFRKRSHCSLVYCWIIIGVMVPSPGDSSFFPTCNNTLSLGFNCAVRIQCSINAGP